MKPTTLALAAILLSGPAFAASPARPADPPAVAISKNVSAEELKSQQKDQRDKLKAQQKQQADQLKAQQKGQRDKMKAEQKDQRDQLKAAQKEQTRKFREQHAGQTGRRHPKLDTAAAKP